jgi:hypothetical protein
MNPTNPDDQLLAIREELHRWLRRCVRRHGAQLSSNLDDLLAIADLALVEASRAHDPSRVSLGAFARVRVKHDTLRYLAQEARHTRNPTLLQPVTPEYHDPIEPLPLPLQSAIAAAGTLEALALRHLLDGEPLKTLARAHAIPEHRLRRIKAALIAAGRCEQVMVSASEPVKPTGDSRPQRPHFAEVPRPHRPTAGRRTHAAERSPRLLQRRVPRAGTIPASAAGDGDATLGQTALRAGHRSRHVHDHASETVP